MYRDVKMEKEEYKKVAIITVVKDLVKEGRLDGFHECLKSVQIQTYPNIEHLIIDGASTDGTVKILDKLKCHYISKPDTGIYQAMNTGIKESSGEYIIFLNSDDRFCTPNAISLLIDKIQHENADYVYAICRMLKNCRTEWLYTEHMPEFWNRMPFNHQTMLCRKDLFDRMGYFDEKYKLASDYKFVLTCILNDAKGCYLPECIADFSLDNRTFKREELSSQEQAAIYTEMYKDFYKFKSSVEAMDLICVHNVSSHFIKCFKAYLYKKKLKNIDIQAVIETLNKVEDSGCNQTTWFLFYYVPILKRKKRNKKTTYYLFGFFPLLRIK